MALVQAFVWGGSPPRSSRNRVAHTFPPVRFGGWGDPSEGAGVASAALRRHTFTLKWGARRWRALKPQSAKPARAPPQSTLSSLKPLAKGT